MSSLKDLRMDQIRQAFEKARASMTFPGLSLVLVTEEYYEKALKFTREYFISKEPTNKSLGMEYTDEMKELWLKCLKLNLSLMLITEDDNEAVGIIRIKIATSGDKIDLSEIHTKPKPRQDKLLFFAHCASKLDFFSHFGVSEAFHIIGLAVSDMYQRRGLAKKLVNTALVMIRHFGIIPVFVKVESSSSFAQRIFEQAGFKTLYEQPFDTWEVGGRYPLKSTRDHKTRKMYGLRIN